MSESVYGYLQILKFALELGDKMLIGYSASRLKDEFYGEMSEILSFDDRARNLDIVNSLLEKGKNEVSIFVDKELEALKDRYLFLLELCASELEKKEAILLKFDDFNKAYYANLGKILQEILSLQKLLAKKAIQRAKDEKERLQKEQIYEDIRRQEDELKQQQEEAKQLKKELNAEDEAEIKRIFKRAVKFCHPDLAGSNQKIKLFYKLNQSYKERDLQGVKELLWELESGVMNSFEDLSEEDLKRCDKNFLMEAIKKLEKKIAALKDENKKLESKAQYDLIMSPEKWDEYFDLERQILEEELKTLQRELEK